MDTKNECKKCSLSHKDPLFWNTHQTMSDGSIWCVTKINEKIPGYKQTPPDWCDDCVAAPGGECPDCGCTHNC